MAATASRQASSEAQERFDTFDAQRAVSAGAETIKWEEQDEARSQPMVPLNFPNAIAIFRFKPGTGRRYNIMVPKLPDDFASDRIEERLTRDFNRRRKNFDGANPKFDLAKVWEVTNGMISFDSIPGNARRQSSGFYACYDRDVYEFIMNCRKKDPVGFQDIVVEYPQRRIKVGKYDVPATQAGWEAAQAAIMAESGDSEE
jgi:hypothetical protein